MWIEYEDAESGRAFFCDIVSEDSKPTWDDPREQWVLASDALLSKSYYRNLKSNAISWEDPRKVFKQSEENGREYFTDCDSGEKSTCDPRTVRFSIFVNFQIDKIH